MHRCAAFVVISVLTASASLAAAPADPRMTEKITYASGYKRLHAVVEDLAKLTGITIRCGSNKNDWQVRDIPMVVCVKDLPLGTLLRTLADASHCVLRAETVQGATEPKSYRIYRTKPLQDAITAWIDAHRKADLALLAWEWDALAQIGSASDGDLQAKLPGKDELVARAKLIASLGPDARDRVLAGEVIRLDGLTQPQVKEWFRVQNDGSMLAPGTVMSSSGEPRISRVDSRGTTLTGTISGGTAITATVSGSGVIVPAIDDNPAPPAHHSADEATSMSAAVALCNGEMDGKPYIALNVRASFAGGSSAGIDHRMNGDSPLKDPKAFSLPPKPTIPDDLQQSKETPGKQYQSLGKDDYSRIPALAAKVKPECEAKSDTVTVSDKLVALSKASGVNIICEDFASHLDRSYSPAKAFHGTETTLGDQLGRLKLSRWFLNEQNRLVLGWAADWQKQHTNLVQEYYLAGLLGKLRGKGVEIEDIVPLYDLTVQQRRAWIDESHELKVLRSARLWPREFPFWDLYASLSADDKALVMSKTGLPLSKFDPEWLAGFFKGKRMANAEAFFGSVFGSAVAAPDEKTIGEYTLRILKDGIRSWDSTTAKPKEGNKAYTYRLDLETRRDGVPTGMSFANSSCQFPIFAP